MLPVSNNLVSSLLEFSLTSYHHVLMAIAITYIVLGVSRTPLTNNSREGISQLILLDSWRSIGLIWENSNSLII